MVKGAYIIYHYPPKIIWIRIFTRSILNDGDIPENIALQGSSGNEAPVASNIGKRNV